MKAALRYIFVSSAVILPCAAFFFFLVALDYVFNVHVFRNTFFGRSQKVYECLQGNQYEEALKHANVFVATEGSDSVYPYCLRARVHALRSDLDAAIRDLTSAISPPSTPRPPR